MASLMEIFVWEIACFNPLDKTNSGEKKMGEGEGKRK